MKYIVIWWVIISTHITCPNNLVEDPYTGELPTQWTLQACFNDHTESKFKEFKTKKEAREFIKNAPDDIKPHMFLDGK